MIPTLQYIYSEILGPGGSGLTLSSLFPELIIFRSWGLLKILMNLFQPQIELDPNNRLLGI